MAVTSGPSCFLSQMGRSGASPFGVFLAIAAQFPSLDSQVLPPRSPAATAKHFVIERPRWDEAMVLGDASLRLMVTGFNASVDGRIGVLLQGQHVAWAERVPSELTFPPSIPLGRYEAELYLEHDTSVRCELRFSIISNTTLAALKDAAPPDGHGYRSDWLQGWRDGELLLADGIVPSQLLPSLQNGFLGTVALSEKIYIAGVYNGMGPGTMSTPPSHRVALPSNLRVELPTDRQLSSSWDMRRATYSVRMPGAEAECAACQVEMRFYAHRTRRHLLVLDVSIHNAGGSAHGLWIDGAMHSQRRANVQ